MNGQVSPLFGRTQTDQSRPILFSNRLRSLRARSALDRHEPILSDENKPGVDRAVVLLRAAGNDRRAGFEVALGSGLEADDRRFRIDDDGLLAALAGYGEFRTPSTLAASAPLVMLPPGARSNGRKPSPVPRMASGKMCTSIAVKEAAAYLGT